MATIHEMTAEARSDEGKGASRRLRRAAKVPAVVYGGGQPPQSIEFDHNAVYLASQKEWFFTSILHLQIGGATSKVLLRDIQRHPYKPIVMHLDFQRISETEKLRLRVPLHFLNQEKSPAGKTAGSVIMHELNDIEISCLPKDLPEYIELDLKDLAIGDIIHVSDIRLPEGVEIPELRLGKEHDHAVVTAKMQAAEVEETAAEGATAAVPAANQKAPDAKGGDKAAPAKKK